MPEPRLRGPILVADDDQSVRALLISILNHFGYLTCEASSGDEALETAKEQPPELVLLEVDLPGICGYEVCRSLRERFGDTLPIIFMSSDRTRSYDRVAGFLVGGDDYLAKPFALDEFVARSRRLMQRSRRASDAARTELTRRETEVLRLYGEGLRPAEIARRLSISPKTVGTHTERIFKKLTVHTRAEAVAAAFRNELIGSRSH
jgi:DNA-binding NarL/FixJ family response regulator